MNSDSEGEELFEDSQNPDLGTDDDFYDVEGKGRNSRQKRTSKDDSQNDGTNASPTFDMNYTQLKNFAGLTSPLASATIQTQEHASQKDSVVSSLSSMSHDEVDNRGAIRAERRSSQETHNSDVSDVSKSNNSEDVDGLYMNRFNDPEVLSKMNKLLSSVTAEGSPNPYFPRESVKITSDKTQTLFKDKLRLVQRLKQHEGAIWTMKISPLGGFLATAGQDTRVLVWRITPLPFELSHTPQKVDALFSPTPFRVYEGHTGDVIDLAWSKSNFILSASTDKTVRLWHITRNDCLQFFRHADIVTSVEFHPAHDRFFISGCFDRRLRLWDIIPDGNVREWAQAPETITSVCFSPDGQTIAVGLIRGQIYFYEYEGMKYKTQMNCRNRSGKYKHGTKVTGMCFTSARKGGANQDLLSAAGAAEKLGTSSGGGTGTGERIQSGGRARKSLNANSQLLVTTNDSRIRLCHLEDYSMLCKYKGLRNKSMQIKASFSEDGRLVICGSETGTVVVWNTLPPARGLGLGSLFGGAKQNRNTASEAFDCTCNTDTATTVAVFAPSATIHTLCKEWNRLNSPGSATSALTSSVAGASITAEAGGLPNVVNFADREAVTSDFCSRIIVTADYTGAVSVYFRLT